MSKRRDIAKNSLAGEPPVVEPGWAISGQQSMHKRIGNCGGVFELHQLGFSRSAGICTDCSIIGRFWHGSSGNGHVTIVPIRRLRVNCRVRVTSASNPVGLVKPRGRSQRDDEPSLPGKTSRLKVLCHAPHSLQEAEVARPTSTQTPWAHALDPRSMSYAVVSPGCSHCRVGRAHQDQRLARCIIAASSPAQ
jgi:hypothetical protein